MNRLSIFLFLLSISPNSLGASFNCTLAQTHVEKLICANPQPSELDAKLATTYLKLRKNLSPEDDKHLVSEQKRWLKNSRDACTDEVCLKKTYNERIAVLNPWSDKNLTCEEMRKYPERIFFEHGIDLGSGNLSPNEVDYECPESLASLPFLKRLLELTETVRSDYVNQCSGSIVNVQWRYYHFELAKAGFAPMIFLQHAVKDQSPGNENYSVRLDYFKQWAQQSPYNFQLYNEFFAEFNTADIRLKDHYAKKFRLAETHAADVAKHVLMGVVARAAGSFPRGTFEPESELVQVASNPRSKLNDLRKLLAGKAVLAVTLASDNAISKVQIYKALRAALLVNKPKEYLAILMENLSAEDLAAFGHDAEPLLAFALNNHDNLRFLLDRQVPVDAANDFGKTALFYAIGVNDLEAVDILLRNKADVNHAYKSAAELRRNGDACIYPNLEHTKRTPLMHAAQHGDVALLKLLIKSGANLNALDDLGNDALAYAREAHENKNEVFLKSFKLKH